MHIAIIGAGGGGLCAARHCLNHNFAIDVFEQTGNVGGTWNYTDFVGLDENGIPVHSSMYQGLKTNIPKELMAFEDFPYPQQIQSYLPSNEVLAYIENYAQKFQLHQYIKFHTRVLQVSPIENNRWSLQYENVKTKKIKTKFYDAIFVCNGHFSQPRIPKIPGIETFPGLIDHSHNYRNPHIYKNKKVVVVGAGPSGLDISQQISKVADKVYLSYKMESSNVKSETANNLIHYKPIITSCCKNTMIFTDHTQIDQIDAILFCTGYYYEFPFLNEKCNIEIFDNRVYPLYKHIINVEHPTMAFIGIPFKVCPFPQFDIQVRFFLATLTGHYKLPIKEEMYQQLEIELKTTQDLRKFHELGEKQGGYFDDLATLANIRKIPNVINNLYRRVRMNRNVRDCFRIIDDDNWEQIQ